MKWLRDKFKPQPKPQEIIKMIVAANSLTAPVNRIALAYKAQAAKIHSLEGMVSDRDDIIAENEKIIALLKAVLDELVPEDQGGSTGGVVG